MKTFGKYLFVQFFSHYLIAALGLVAIFYLQKSIAEILRTSYMASQVLYVNALLIPKVFVQFSPCAVFLAVLMTLASMNRAGELVACYAIGMGLRHITALLLFFVFFISCFSIVIEDRLAPPFFKKRTYYYWVHMRHRKNFFLELKKDQIWYRSRNVIYNMKSFDAKKKEAYGLKIYVIRPNWTFEKVIFAKKARYEKNMWKLSEGSLTTFTDSKAFPKAQFFKKLELLIQEKPEDFMEIEKEVETMRLKDLYRYIQKIRQTGVNTSTYETQFYSRISLALLPFVMALLAIPFAVRFQRSGGLGRDMGIGLLLVLFYWISYTFGLSLGKANIVSPFFGAFFPTAIFALIAIAMMTRIARKAA